jgi:hypothetical protein
MHVVRIRLDDEAYELLKSIARHELRGIHWQARVLLLRAIASWSPERADVPSIDALRSKEGQR